MSASLEPGSFRDPSGFIFTREDTLFRQVQPTYQGEYDRLMASGLYQALVDADLLIPHAEERTDSGFNEGAYRVLRPERIPFLSYPYEWSFSQLKDAALTTIRIQKEAMRFGMSLKDASAYNIQFRSGKPVMIDTLSFECYEEGKPWVAYRQFCQHFLAPLALMSRRDIRLGLLLRSYLDGVPLDLASQLLPRSTWLDPALLMHVHLHGAAQKKYSDQPTKASAASGSVSRTALLGLVDSLEGAVKKQSWKPAGTIWGAYYSQTNYSDRAMDGKRALVGEMYDQVTPRPEYVWDLGANTGAFSKIACERGAYTIAWDNDPAAVEKNYLECKASGETRMLPLLQDLTDPSPGRGWNLQERQSLPERGPADLLFALALVHHLAIGNNVPLVRIAQFFAELGPWLIIEFVPKSDSQVKRLLASREDIFTGYTEAQFEVDFGQYYKIIRKAAVPDSERTLYLMTTHRG